MVYATGIYEAHFFIGHWEAYTAKKEQLPFQIDEGGARKTPLLRSPDRKQGLADITRETSRLHFPFL